MSDTATGSTRSTVRRAGRVLSWAGVVVIACVVTACVLVPRATGSTPYTILTGSMRPSMPPGTLVVVRPVAPDEIGVGTVVTYQLESGKPTVVTHRVVAQGVDADGGPVFQTQGDANPSPDPRWVRPAQIRGERWYTVPWIGHVSTLLNGRQHQLLDVGFGLLLLGYAGQTLLKGRRDRRQAAQQVDAGNEEPEHARVPTRG